MGDFVETKDTKFGYIMISICDAVVLTRATSKQNIE